LHEEKSFAQAQFIYSFGLFENLDFDAIKRRSIDYAVFYILKMKSAPKVKAIILISSNRVSRAARTFSK
jgi:hypothetical protein